MAKSELAGMLHGSGALEALLRARVWSRPPWLTAITYHRLHEDPSEQPFDQGVIDATPKQFEEQVKTLKRYFTVVGIEEILHFMRGGSLPPNPAIITFDDGYRECFDKALPVLMSEGVKATFFVSTSYVTERRVFWWDRISYLLRHTDRPTIHLEYPKQMELDLTTSRERSQRRLLEIAKRAYGLDIDRFLDELAQACGVSWDSELERQYADELVMTWDQIRALRAAGMEVHSHTRTHRTLQSLPTQMLRQELLGARHDIEEQLGEPINAISYPVGRSIAQLPLVREAVKEAGYELGFSNCSGSTWTRGSLDPLDMRRISVDYDLPIAYFRALLAIPMFQ